MAQGDLISVSAAVDRSVITVGDPLRYTLTVARDTSLTVRAPGKVDNLGTFEILAYDAAPPENDGRRIVERFAYTVTVFDTGRFVIPPFPVAYQSDDSADVQFITADPLEIVVESVITEAEPELKDIRPPFDLPGGWLWRAILIALAVIWVLTVALVIWLIRRNRAGEPVFRKEVIRPAHEIALEELEALLAENLIAAGAFKPFYTRLSDILRRYVEQRYYVPAMEETSSELVDSLRHANLADRHLTLVTGVLHNSDLVKFAKYVPSDGETDTTVGMLRDLLSETGIAFEPVEHRVATAEPAAVNGERGEG